MSYPELSSLTKCKFRSQIFPAGVGRRELSDGGPSVPAGQEEVVVKEEDSARWRNGGNPADKIEARGRAGERGWRPGEKRRRSAEREGERGHRSYEAASGVKEMRKPQVGKFRCDVENCGFSSAYGANLDRHKKRSCIEVKGDGASKRRVGGEYRCSQCPKSYARKASLRRHGEDEHGPRQFCPHCGFGIKKSRLSRHVKVCSRRRLEKVSRNEPEAEERSEDDEETEQEPEDIASLEKLGQDLESLID